MGKRGKPLRLLEIGGRISVPAAIPGSFGVGFHISAPIDWSVGEALDWAFKDQTNVEVQRVSTFKETRNKFAARPVPGLSAWDEDVGIPYDRQLFDEVLGDYLAPSVQLRENGSSDVLTYYYREDMIRKPRSDINNYY